MSTTLWDYSKHVFDALSNNLTGAFKEFTANQQVVTANINQALNDTRIVLERATQAFNGLRDEIQDLKAENERLGAVIRDLQKDYVPDRVLVAENYQLAVQQGRALTGVAAIHQTNQ